ncbi:putative addiction module component, TIGR02574 family [Formivibrio citricus]|uniref:Putative addiction module component, TIGR02574 family n=1 Tax=Formivibrio citricus TaxID=83765 RepID=A0A1I4XCM1_9NEIS|nr:addiction module protein [Formivibrio citricus]SFN23647.1 putative addiction module component, TIGR02574 family [Formivibrio citricus]
MTPTPIETIEAAAMQLPKADRIHLAERLLASLEEDDEIQTAWIAEAERRADALDSGTTQAIAIEDAMAQLRGSLQH